MNGYEKQRNSSEMLGLGKVQLGDARAWNRAEEQSRGEEQNGKAQQRCSWELNCCATELP